MLGYVCKYAPVEIFESMGTEICRIDPSVTSFNRADALMHANICSFTKAVLEDVMTHDYEGMIFTTCCDSMRRLYDTLKHQFPHKFFYLLDLPRKVNDFAAKLYETQIRKMIDAYQAFSGRSFQPEALVSLIDRKNQAARLRSAPAQPYDLHIGLAGARPGKDLKNLLENLHAEVLFDLTCTGIQRTLTLDPEQVLYSYSFALLNQIPCMRMMEAVSRERFIDAFRDRLDGMIYHTIKFCDMYSYEYEKLHNQQEIPLVLIETDATAQCSGQIRTRTEAFLESLRVAKSAMTPKPVPHTGKDGSMYILGIDSGSTSTNAVIMDQNKQLLTSLVLRTGAKSAVSAETIRKKILAQAGLIPEDLSCTVSTGYGRVSIPFADYAVTEISCHAKGAHHLKPTVRTILDIGGQDSKAIRINDLGEVTDFVMNDKCAAGTGRFLEMMAHTLELSIDDLGPISLSWTEDIEISSMCSVFAESEVISLIAQNKEKCDIAHGIHKAIAGKALSLLRRVGLEGDFMMTGGVAKNAGVVKVLEETLGKDLFIYEEPEIIGALGAALYGLEQLTQNF